MDSLGSEKRALGFIRAAYYDPGLVMRMYRAKGDPTVIEEELNNIESELDPDKDEQKEAVYVSRAEAMLEYFSLEGRAKETKIRKQEKDKK